MSTPRFLLASLEVPGFGGSSTAGYDLFVRMQRDGHNVHLVNLIDEQDAGWYAYTFGASLGNPSGVPDVNTCAVAPGRGPSPALRQVIESVAPSCVLGIGHIATNLVADTSPGVPLALLTGSCRQASRYVTTWRARDMVSLAKWLDRHPGAPAIVDNPERRAVTSSDLILTHSRTTLDMMRRFFPRHTGRIHPRVISFAEWICDGARPWQHLARPFPERDIDVLFIAADWRRPEKNFPYVRALARRFAAMNVHVVGAAPDTIPGVTHHGFLPGREPLFQLLARARCVACPSTADAAPGILFEASIMGANVVASRNCGNWDLCHESLLADPFTVGAFVAAIRRAREARHDDHLDAFLALRSYDELVATLHAFARPFRPEVM